MSGPLLEVHALSLAYRGERGRVTVLQDIGLTLEAGETLGVVGESGSGKSQLALALMGLLPAHAELAGRLRFEGQDLLALDARARRRLRGARMGLVFQDPMTSLNPHLKLGLQLAEVLEVHRGATRKDALAEAASMLDAVRVPEPRRRLGQYPHELSGGQRQRVMIAMMLLAKPALLIADEPTTALDVTVQAELLRLLAELRRDFGLSLLLISHDLGVIGALADRVLVLHAGQQMEQGPRERMLDAPAHPYTQALLACRPRLDSPLYLAAGQPLPGIAGVPQRPSQRGAGCSFAPRCPLAVPGCESPQPLREIAPDHRVACHRVVAA